MKTRNQETEQTLIRVFNEMPDQFKSNEFAARCHRYGIKKEKTATGMVSEFLHPKAVQIGGKNSRTWTKKFKSIATLELPNDDLEQFEIKRLLTDGVLQQYVIPAMKELGYKILKPITEYKEI